MLLQGKFLLSFIIFLSALLFAGCGEYILNPDIPEEELIGTWRLTKILASYPAGKKELSPGAENLTMVIALNGDGTYNSNQNNRGEITDENGTWTIEHAVLTLHSSGEIYSFPCRINENVLQTSTMIIDPDSGTMLPVTLEFTKDSFITVF